MCVCRSIFFRFTILPFVLLASPLPSLLFLINDLIWCYMLVLHIRTFCFHSPFRAVLSTGHLLAFMLRLFFFSLYFHRLESIHTHTHTHVDACLRVRVPLHFFFLLAIVARYAGGEVGRGLQEFMSVFAHLFPLEEAVPPPCHCLLSRVPKMEHAPTHRYVNTKCLSL